MYRIEYKTDPSYLQDQFYVLVGVAGETYDFLWVLTDFYL